MTKICNNILVSAYIPEEWGLSHIILIYKKGPKRRYRKLPTNKENLSKLYRMFVELNSESTKVGLSINISKTKLLTKSAHEDIKIDNLLLEYINEYTYLGPIIFYSDQTTKDIKKRIAAGWTKYWSLKEVMKSTEFTSIVIKRSVQHLHFTLSYIWMRNRVTQKAPQRYVQILSKIHWKEHDEYLKIRKKYNYKNQNSSYRHPYKNRPTKVEMDWANTK